MGYPRDIDDYSDQELLVELDRRRKLRLSGLCDYCKLPLESGAGCRYKERHFLREMDEAPTFRYTDCGDIVHVKRTEVAGAVATIVRANEDHMWFHQHVPMSFQNVRTVMREWELLRALKVTELRRNAPVGKPGPRHAVEGDRIQEIVSKLSGKDGGE